MQLFCFLPLIFPFTSFPQVKQRLNRSNFSLYQEFFGVSSAQSYHWRVYIQQPSFLFQIWDLADLEGYPICFSKSSASPLMEASQMCPTPFLLHLSWPFLSLISHFLPLTFFYSLHSFSSFVPWFLLLSSLITPSVTLLTMINVKADLTRFC
jgi:hypothetical protein